MDSASLLSPCCGELLAPLDVQSQSESSRGELAFPGHLLPRAGRPVDAKRRHRPALATASHGRQAASEDRPSEAVIGLQGLSSPLHELCRVPSYAWGRSRVWQWRGHKLPHSAQGFQWECGGPKRGWVMLPGFFAGGAALQLGSGRTLGPSPRLMTPDRRAFRTGVLTGMACCLSASTGPPATGPVGQGCRGSGPHTHSLLHFICFTNKTCTIKLYTRSLGRFRARAPAERFSRFRFHFRRVRNLKSEFASARAAEDGRPLSPKKKTFLDNYLGPIMASD